MKRVLAIDVGIYNMAAAILTNQPLTTDVRRHVTELELKRFRKRHTQMTDARSIFGPASDYVAECVFLKVEPIAPKKSTKPSPSVLCKGLRDFLDSLPMNDCTDIVVESQMTRKFAQLEFAILYHCLGKGLPVHSINARTKFSHLGMAPKLSYTQRKSWAVRATSSHLFKLKERCGPQVAYFADAKKRDDLADAYLMALNLFYHDVALRIGAGAADEPIKPDDPENAALSTSGVAEDETSGMVLVDSKNP